MADVVGVDLDATEFRAGIHLAMGLGMPADTDQWPAFILLTDPTTPDPDVDADGVPWETGGALEEPAEQVVDDVLCAVEWPPGTKETLEQWGPLQPGQLRITLLDTEYVRVEGFDHVLVWPTLGGDAVEYSYRKVLGRYALGGVEVWTLLVAAEDVA